MRLSFKLAQLAALIACATAFSSGSALASTYFFRQAAAGITPAPAVAVVPPPPTCTTPWSASLTDGAAVTAYQLATVPYGSTCVSEQRTCAAGVLSGSYTQQSCVVNPQSTVQDFGTYHAWSDGTYAASCNAYRTATGAYAYAGATGSGTYRISTGGGLDVYCDMVSAGGGWTRVVRQFESTVVTSWTGGTNGSSYTLAPAQIPAHTQVAFGKDEVATFIDYFNWTYSTADIAVVSLTGVASGKVYKAHRSVAGYYANHNPTVGGYSATCVSANGNWCNTLTLAPLTGSPAWAFSPWNNYMVGYRGYAMDSAIIATADAFAWTVWVR